MKMAMMCLAMWCGTANAIETTIPVSAQEIAQHRADYMVANNLRGHAPYSVGNPWRVARFEGVGWSGGGALQQQIGTCQPRYQMRLVGDAYATNGRMSVRVRLWR